MATQRESKAAFGGATRKSEKKGAGSTDVVHTPLNVRTAGMNVSDDVRTRTRAKMGAKLGKYANRIERLSVRFEDDHGLHGGEDTICRVKVVLSGMDSIVFESRGGDALNAMQRAASGVERAVRRTLERVGHSFRPKSKRGETTKSADESVAKPPASTADRNFKENTSGATSALEGSEQARPSRKSTRKSANRSKRDSNLQRRQIRRVSSPKARAERAQ